MHTRCEDYYKKVPYARRIQAGRASVLGLYRFKVCRSGQINFLFRSLLDQQHDCPRQNQLSIQALGLKFHGKCK